MTLLEVFANGKQETFYKHLKIMKEQYHIRLAVIGFNQPLREILYFLFPHIVIIIEPRSVMKMIDFHLGYNPGLEYIQEEIAVTLEEEILLIQEIPLSARALYASKTKEEAINYYRQWQSYIPLGIKSFHHVVRKIDFFHKEVFNYFQ